jgi:hypothetical protein
MLGTIARAALIERFMRFATPTKFKNIHQYFGIPETTCDGSIQTTLDIYLEPQEILGDYILVIHRKQKHLAEAEGVPLLFVPKDIERLIYKYFTDSNTIKILMHIPLKFPIRPPKFKFIEATHRAKEIEHIVDKFKCSLAPGYSPSFGIEKCVLYLLSNLLQELHYI